MKVQRIQVKTEYQIRLDTYLGENTDLTRSHVKKLCDEGFVKVDGIVCKGKKIISNGCVVEFCLPDVQNLDITPENIEIDILYQDSDIAVINKPQGMVVHAGNGTKGKTLVNALLYHLDSLSGINGVIRPGIVHRIDKNTSGLLVVAKNDKAHISLAKQLEDKTCSRVYVALLEGVVKQDKGRICTFISRNEKDRKKRAVSNHGREAITNFTVIKRYKEYTLCEFSLETGRTHQIRVHAKHIGHPIVGDKEYGYKNQKFKLEGQLLHAKQLTFIHPTKKEKVTFTCNIPEYFEKVIKKIN